MLVLSRKVGDKVYIGDDITVTVVQLCGNQVRIGIDAPRSVPIRRHELLTESSTLPEYTSSPDEKVSTIREVGVSSFASEPSAPAAELIIV